MSFGFLAIRVRDDAGVTRGRTNDNALAIDPDGCSADGKRRMSAGRRRPATDVVGHVAHTSTGRIWRTDFGGDTDALGS